MEAMARMLKLPSEALSEDKWQLIEGRLLELKREPWNIQVLEGDGK